MKRVLRATAFFGLGLLLLQGCISKTRILPPLPDRVNCLDGFGSLTLRGEKGSAKTRFSFRFSFPDLGRIEAVDVFGRSLSVLLFKEGIAYFILPSRNAYWTAPEEDVWERFLGVRLKAREVAGLMSGQWKDFMPPDPDEGPVWTFGRDARGRVLDGRKSSFRFEVKEFFQTTSVPRKFAFSEFSISGEVRLLNIQFNRPPRGDVFGLSVLKGRSSKTWPEMEALLNDED